MIDDGLFVTAQHPFSRRWAIVDDDGRAAWLYLTAPDSQAPIADCWLYNRVPAPAGCDVARGEPPVVPASYTETAEPFAPPPEESVRVLWSPDGESVAVYFDDQLMGFIANATGPGYSALLRVSGPFGQPVDAEMFAATFAVA